MADTRHARGRDAEDAAARFLARAGLVVVERNVRFPLGELDLVCRDGGAWVFVEVKCRPGVLVPTGCFPRGGSMRRALVSAVALALPLTWIAFDPPGHPAAQGPITISVIDVSGDLSSTRVIIENYARANPQKVKAANFQ